MAAHADMAAIWQSAPPGKLSPLQQMRAVALRDAVRDIQGASAVNMKWIADRLTLAGGGNHHPTRQAVRKLLQRVDADKKWYPGKAYRVRNGPRPRLTKAKRRAIAAAMMSAKKSGEEPSPALALQRCPGATKNPATSLPFSPRHIRRVLLEDCYDISPDHPWRYQRCLQKTWISPEMRGQRLAWARAELAKGYSDTWHFDNVIWLDPQFQGQARGGEEGGGSGAGAAWHKRYLSDNAKEYSRNLRGKKYAATQNSWGDTRFRYVVVLTRGKLHVEVMPDGWKETGDDLACFVAKLPRILSRMLGRTASKPKVLFTDRGPGMFIPNTGHATGPYLAAVQKRGFSLYTGPDASSQPADIPDVLLHETAVSLFKRELSRERPCRPAWKETREEFVARVSKAAAETNRRCNLHRLCCGYLKRLQLVVEKKGDRLKK